MIPSTNNAITGSNGQATFTFTSMAKGTFTPQDLGFNTHDLSQVVVVDSSNWGNSVTITTPAFPASDGINRGGFLVCGLFSTNNGSIYITEHTNVRVTN